MQRRAKSKHSNVSRERILQVATELFAQKGYKGTGVDELAARAQIAKTAIYYHFGSKEGLLAAVAERAAGVWTEGVQQAARQAGTPLERLDRALAGMRAILEDRPWILKLLQILALEVAEENPDVRETLKSIIRQARQAIVDGIHDALGMELVGTEFIAGAMLALLDGFALGRQVDPDEVPLDAAFEEMRQIVVFMVATRIAPDMLSVLMQGAPTPALPQPLPGGALQRAPRD